MTDGAKGDAAEFVRRVGSRDLVIGIVGMGYVGIPLALSALGAGFKVIGFDIDAARVEQLNRGETNIRHIKMDLIHQGLAAGRFEATADTRRFGEADALLIAVPTPLTKYRDPDLSYVVNTAHAIGRTLRPGQLVVLESTTYPGTTDDVVRPILEKESGLKSGLDFFLAFSPEREDPGNENYGTSTIPKVVGGDGPAALMAAEALYGALVVRTVPVSSTATAEATKLTENIFRAVNIALVNELKIVYAAMGVDVWEVIDAAKTKPFGFMPFYPGPGLGGHCIPIDPFYLTWKAREYDLTTRFIELAGQINSGMPYIVITRLGELLGSVVGKPLAGSRILMIGLAYKKNIEDMRESPSLKLLEIAEKQGASVDFHDPYVPVVPMTREHADLAGRKSVALSAEVLTGYDAVLIATDHDIIDYHLIAAHSKLVVDTRNVCARLSIGGDNIRKA
jgi:UDP-N-acetyl-D-glucosamine dehydrogenase